MIIILYTVSTKGKPFYLFCETDIANIVYTIFTNVFGGVMPDHIIMHLQCISGVTISPF